MKDVTSSGEMGDRDETGKNKTNDLISYGRASHFGGYHFTTSSEYVLSEWIPDN